MKKQQATVDAGTDDDLVAAWRSTLEYVSGLCRKPSLGRNAKSTGDCAVKDLSRTVAEAFNNRV